MLLEIKKIFKYEQRLFILTFISINGNSGFQIFYKSAGISNHENKNCIFPAYFLKTKAISAGDPFNQMCYGWIPKIIKINGDTRSYRSKKVKKLSADLSLAIEKLTKDIEVIEAFSPEDIIHNNDPETINKSFEDIILDKKEMNWIS